MLLRKTALSVFVLCAMAGIARAESFRCPTTELFVEIGDTQAQVEAKCGLPSAEKIVKGGRRGGTQIRWIYDFGYAYFTRILLFQRGYLIRIDDSDYGKAQ
ncbi:MAG TPA: DUF2845 domain-containing protein [Polyangia bacterium]